ncbi:MAG: hypothetical protein HY815_20820 [Candidatus Riflebacteria bacterium]|nr:hypothetical protein [Candidatus Riflebacteria bacterium]
MRSLNLLGVALAAVLLLGLGTHALAEAVPPAVPPPIKAEFVDNDIVFTFPEGVDQKSVSFKFNGCSVTRHCIRHHRRAIRWTSPTEMRVAHHFINKVCRCNPHEGFWVEGECKGYVALLQFVVVANLPLYHKSSCHKSCRCHCRKHHRKHHRAAKAACSGPCQADCKPDCAAHCKAGCKAECKPDCKAHCKH